MAVIDLNKYRAGGGLQQNQQIAPPTPPQPKVQTTSTTAASTTPAVVPIVQPKQLTPEPANLEHSPSVSTWDNVKNFVSSSADQIYRSYIKPLKYVPGELGITVSPSGISSEYVKQQVKSVTPKEALDVVQGAATGIASGLTLGIADPILPKPTTEKGKEAESISNFLSFFIPYDMAERTFAGVLASKIPKLVLEHPAIMKAVSTLASFIGTSQLSREAFTLTPEERASGMTHIEKRAEIAAGDLLTVVAFEALGLAWKKNGKAAIDEFVKAAQGQITKNATEVAKGSLAETSTKGAEDLFKAKESTSVVADLVKTEQAPEDTKAIEEIITKSESPIEKNHLPAPIAVEPPHPVDKVNTGSIADAVIGKTKSSAFEVLNRNGIFSLSDLELKVRGRLEEFGIPREGIGMEAGDIASELGNSGFEFATEEAGLSINNISEADAMTNEVTGYLKEALGIREEFKTIKDFPEFPSNPAQEKSMRSIMKKLESARNFDVTKLSSEEQAAYAEELLRESGYSGSEEISPETLGSFEFKNLPKKVQDSIKDLQAFTRAIDYLKNLGIKNPTEFQISKAYETMSSNIFNPPTKQQKSLITSLLSMLNATEEQIKALEKAPLETKVQASQRIDGLLRIKSEQIIEALQNNDIGRLSSIQIFRGENAGRLKEIVSNYIASKGNKEALSRAIVEAFGETKSGARWTIQANRLVDRLGFGSVDELKAAIDKETVSEIGKVADSKLASLKESNPVEYYKQRYISQGVMPSNAEFAEMGVSPTRQYSMMKSWESESLTKSLKDPYIAEKRYQNTEKENGSPFAKVDQIVNKNKAEVDLNLHKKMEAGFISIPRDAKPEFINSEIEKRFKQQFSFLDSVNSHFQSLKEGVVKWIKATMAEPELDKNLVKDFPSHINWRNKLYGIPNEGIQMGARAVTGIIGDSKKEEYDVFNRMLAASDLIVTKGSGKDVMLGLKEDQLKQYFEQVISNTEQMPKAREMLQRHAELMGRMREAMQDIGWMEPNWRTDVTPEKRIELEKYFQDKTGIGNIKLEDLYFPHYIVDYTKEKMLGRQWIPAEMRTPFKPYTKARIGSFKDIVTDYKSVMNDYLSSVFTDAMTESQFASEAKKWDALRLMNKDEISALYYRAADGAPIMAKDLPEVVQRAYPNTDKFIFHQLERGNYVYPAMTADEKKVQAFIEANVSFDEYAEMADARELDMFKERLVIGKKKPIFLFPEPVYKSIKNLNKQALPDIVRILAPLRGFNKFWKPVVTNYFGGLNWRQVKWFGDATMLATKDPAAYSKLAQATKIAWDIATDKTPADIKAAEFIRRLKEERIPDSSFVRGEMTPLGPDHFDNPFKKIDTLLRNSVSVPDMIPKIASILQNLERFNAGKPIVLRGAESYVKSLAAQGAVEEAVYAFGRGLTVDYTAIPKGFKSIMSDGLAPFASFQIKIMSNVSKVFRDSPAVLVGYLGALAAMHLWNTSPSNKKYEDGLPAYMQATPHIIMGRDDRGTVHILTLDNVLNKPLELIGGEETLNTIIDATKGDISPEDAAWKIAGNTLVSPVLFTAKMLNPVIQAIYGIKTNKDPFTGGSIVPKDVMDSGDQASILKYRVQYFLKQSFTPLTFFFDPNVVSVTTDPASFIKEVMSRPLGTPFLKDYTDGTLLSNSYQNKTTEQQGKIRVWNKDFGDTMINYVIHKDNSDKDKLQTMMTEMASGKSPVDGQGLNDYLSSSAFVDEALSIIKTNITDPKQKNNLERMLAFQRILQTFKTAPREDKAQIFQSIFQ